MAWYTNMKLWAAVLTALMIIGAFAAVFAGKTAEFKEVAPFLGLLLGGGVLGYTMAAKKKE